MGAHSAPRSKASFYLMIAAAAGLVAVAWWFLFLRGGGDPTGGSASRAQTDEQSATLDTSGSTEVKERSVTGIVETSEVFASRDPFAPLVEKDKGATGSTGERDPNVVSLEGVTDPSPGGRAQIGVNGAVHNVADGEVFAHNFKLLSVSGDCASMLFGDDQFTICEGEEILK